MAELRIKRTFITTKGTEIPIHDLHGKEYMLVQWRVVWFREEWPFAKIETQRIEKNDKYVVYKAEVSIPWDSGYRKLSEATKREDYETFRDAEEKSETGAIGRALALCGYGAQFAPELFEEHRIVDAPISRPEQKLTPAKELLAPVVSKSKPMATAELGNLKMDVGKFKDRLFKEIAFQDKSSAFGYAQWIQAELGKGGQNKMSAMQIEFVKYMGMLEGTI